MPLCPKLTLNQHPGHNCITSGNGHFHFPSGFVIIEDASAYLKYGVGSLLDFFF